MNPPRVLRALPEEAAILLRTVQVHLLTESEPRARRRRCSPSIIISAA